MNREFERQVSREVCGIVDCCTPNRDRRITRAFELKFDSNQRLKMMHHLYVRYGFVMRESEAVHMKTVGDVASWYTRRADKMESFKRYLEGIRACLITRRAIDANDKVKFTSQLREHQRPYDLVLSREQHQRLVLDLSATYGVAENALTNAKTVAELCEVLHTRHDTFRVQVTADEVLAAVALLAKYRLSVLVDVSAGEDAPYRLMVAHGPTALTPVPFEGDATPGSYENALVGALRVWLRMTGKEDLL
jgi:hypothetical protein